MNIKNVSTGVKSKNKEKNKVSMYENYEYKVANNKPLITKKIIQSFIVENLAKSKVDRSITEL